MTCNQSTIQIWTAQIMAVRSWKTDATTEILQQMISCSKSDKLFPWDRCESYIYNRYKAILQRALLSTDRRSAFHRLRRTVLTAHSPICMGCWSVKPRTSKLWKYSLGNHPGAESGGCDRIQPTQEICSPTKKWRVVFVRGRNQRVHRVLTKSNGSLIHQILHRQTFTDHPLIDLMSFSVDEHAKVTSVLFLLVFACSDDHFRADW